jgi:DNA-binding Lrp family transcriptional regulator
MAINSYGVAANGNPTNVHAIAKLLKSADVVEVLDKCGILLETVPMNKNETVSWLRAVTPDPRVEEVAEGVNPAARVLVYEQVTKTFEEYAEVFAVTSRQAELGEYDVLAHLPIASDPQMRPIILSWLRSIACVRSPRCSPRRICLSSG